MIELPKYLPNFSGAWQSLPNLTIARAAHGCARIQRNNRDYIMVFGGVTFLGIPTQTIEFYDMTLRPASWELVPGLSLPLNMPRVLGSKVLAFDVNFCDAMMFSAVLDQMVICSGNYNWTSLKPVGYRQLTVTKFAVVDASMFGGTNSNYQCEYCYN